MNIRDLQDYAEDNGSDSVKFKFVNLKGETVKGRWLDAFFGMFILNEESGFITVKQWRLNTGDQFDFEVISEEEYNNLPVIN